MACTTEPRVTNRTSCCCCKPCEHDEFSRNSDCDMCCKCIPRYLCIIFYPNNRSVAPTGSEVQHLGDGIYEASSSHGVLVTIGRVGSGTFWENDYGECVWRVIYDTVGTNLDIDEEFPVYESTGTNPVWDYGCLIGEDDELITEETTVGGQLGRFHITPILRELTPKEQDAKGCVSRMCSNCTCFPACACIRYNIHYYGCDDLQEFEVPDREGSIRRVQNICWDPDVGDNGGWYAEFEGETDLSCSPEVTVLIEIVEIGTSGKCELVLTTTGVGGPDPQFNQDSAQLTLNCDNLSNYWEWGTVDATTGTGSIRKCDDPVEGTASLPFFLSQISINTDNCDLCTEQCCEFLPATLVATIEADQCTHEPVDFILYRNECHSATYSGIATSVPWGGPQAGTDCEAEGPGTGSCTIGFVCLGCYQDYSVAGTGDPCRCDCVGTEDPGVAGCGSITTFLLTNFDGSTIGNVDFLNGECGAHLCGDVPQLGTFVDSNCTPLYNVFCGPVQGLDNCCDDWSVIITEPVI